MRGRDVGSLLGFVSLVFVLHAQEPAALRIIVIDGEDGVNIISKKTAVQPVIQVRDKNDQPVAGALVTLTIQGENSASFGNNLTQLVLGTDANGRAAATSLRATSEGPLRIELQASYRGDTATATINQSNFVRLEDVPPDRRPPDVRGQGVPKGLLIGGIVGGGAIGGAVIARKVIGALCLSEAEQVNSTADNVLAVCVNSRPSFAQCQSAEQANANAVAQFCTCRGDNLSSDDIDVVRSSISTLRSLGVNTTALSTQCRV